MDDPIVINGNSFQEVWVEATKLLSTRSWEHYNLIAYINKPSLFDVHLNQRITRFAEINNILTPKHVAYTIFPIKQYKRSARKLYSKYLDKFYPWTRKREKSGWGTYFHRMICYEGRHNKVNQLDNIIQAIKKRQAVSKAAYTIIIPHPGGETIRPLGGPCLNYIAIQILPGDRKSIGLLAVYRNHDFLERAYGNYWGLCELLKFIAKETKSKIGPITCISSHAYVPGKKNSLKIFLDSI